MNAANKEKIKVRFAPSPTGFLHLGSARTALFNWLYARHTAGEFLLRIEDTDRERSKKEFLDEILEDLKWLGMDYDGEPLFQSKRTGIYKGYAEKILDAKKAYKEGDAIIFRVEKSRIIKVKDIVHGEVEFNTDEIKDQVLIKSDGYPAYNFACVVDDHDMGITHVIRGDDHVSNTPKQLMLYEALGFKSPTFAHMPLMMGKDGSKLSKRHGGVSISEYKKDGFLPEALSNYLLLLGWSPGGEREIISLEEAKKIFKLEDLGDVQAKFDVEKLKWMNGEYLRGKNEKELTRLLKLYGYISGDIDDGYLEKVINLYKTRIRILSEFAEPTQCFFKEDFSVDKEAKKKLDKYLKDEKVKDALTNFRDELSRLAAFSKEQIEGICRQIAEKYSVKPAAVIHATRAAISGRTGGAGLFEMMEVLGKKRVVERIGKIL